MRRAAAVLFPDKKLMGGWAIVITILPSSFQLRTLVKMGNTRVHRYSGFFDSWAACAMRKKSYTWQHCFRYLMWDSGSCNKISLCLSKSSIRNTAREDTSLLLYNRRGRKAAPKSWIWRRAAGHTHTYVFMHKIGISSLALAEAWMVVAAVCVCASSKVSAGAARLLETKLVHQSSSSSSGNNYNNRSSSIKKSSTQSSLAGGGVWMV